MKKVITKLYGGSNKNKMTTTQDYGGIQKSLFDFDDDKIIIPLCNPFVKWAGGKTQLLTQLYTAPVKFDRYFEPFLGGGALFFYLVSAKHKQFTSAYISDINSELINSYIAIKDNVERLIEFLKLNQVEYSNKKDSEKYYYRLRSNYNNKECTDSTERAAQFITLNRTCFNGLYRVNRNGIFNVPWGKYTNPLICDSSNLRNVSLALRCSNATIKVSDYKKMLLEENTAEGDFIYLDPPYNPESSTAYFTGYTDNEFSTKDQRELADIFRKLDSRKCKVMLTNSDTPLIRELYTSFANYTVKVESKRAINCKAEKRQGHTDLIIRNYS